MRKIFLLATVLLAFGCTERGENEAFVLPKGYTGYVIIIYGQQDGEEKYYKDNKRVYNIPKTGVLKTKFNADYGWTSFPEFYYESIDVDKKIPVVIEWKDYSEDKVNATMPSTGKSYKNIDGTGATEYSTFIVGTKSQIKKASEELTKIHIADLVEN